MESAKKSFARFLHKEGNKNLVFLIVSLAVLFFFFSSVTDYFNTGNNFTNMMRQMAELGMITVPVSMLIMTGNIDLSISAVMGVCAITAARIMRDMGSIPLAVCAALLIGILIGVLNGFFVGKLHLAGIVATLGTQVMLRGLCYILTNGRPVSNLPNEFVSVSIIYIGGMSLSFLLMLIQFAAAIFIMQTTSFGVKLHAIGYNSKASTFSGIKSDKIKFLLYVYSGFVGAVASLFMLTRLASAESAFGTGYDTDTLVSVLIGGIAITGGEGNLAGSLLGMLTISIVRNGMNHMRISALYQQIIIGALIVVAVAKWKKQKN